MDDLLLRIFAGPVGRDVVGRQLNPYSRFSLDHHVPVVLGIDGAVEHCGSETALCREIGGVEHDLMPYVHRSIPSTVTTLELLECGPEALDEPEPRHLARFAPKVRQKLGQPYGVVPQMQLSDQHRPVGIRPLEHVEELTGSRRPMCRDDSLADVLVHVAKIGRDRVRQHDHV
jgi:hypothetical protein